MAANEIVFSVKVQKDGNLKVIAKDSDAAAKGTKELGDQTDNLSKKRTNFQKVEKGVGQAGLSTAKGFSKQAGIISSGLVPAYAVLAANIFAITAAFNALKEAAQVKALEEGFAALGNEVGRTSTLMADRLVKITGGALSMSEALRASAAGFSAGFSMKELEGLAQIARSASIALGRDLGDALDRLVRGTAKLEPEILDELGIFIRLDDAADQYALSLGKTGDQLTNVQRRQAFLNAALTQGERKFSAVGDVDINPFNKLAAAARNLAEGFLRAVNVAIVPFLNFLANNALALIGVLVLFGSTVVSQMIPALKQMGEAQKEAADEALKGAKDAAKASKARIKSLKAEIRTTKTAMSESSKFAKLQGRFGTRKQKKGDAEALQKSLTRSIAIREKNVKQMSGTAREEYQKEIDKLKELQATVLSLKAAEEGTGSLVEEVELKKSLHDVQSNLADSMTEVQNAGAIGGFKEAWKGTMQYKDGIKGTTHELGIFGKILPGNWGQKMAGMFSIAGAGAKLFGFALTNAIPIIGQILFVGGLLLSLFKKLWGSAYELSEAQKALNTVIDTMGEKFEQLEITLDKSRARMAAMTDPMEELAEKGFQIGAEYKVLNGVVAETAETFGMLAEEIKKSDVGVFAGIAMRFRQGFINPAKKAWNEFVAFIKDGWEDIKNAMPDLGFWDFLVGSDEEIKSDLIKEAFIDPLEELKAQKPEEFARIFAEQFKGIGDPNAPNAVRELAEALHEQGIASFEAAKATGKLKKETTLSDVVHEKFAGSLRKAKEGTQELVDITSGAAKVFEDMNEKIGGFFSEAAAKDKFATLNQDVGLLRENLAGVAKNGENTEAVLTKIKKDSGAWVSRFFSDEEWKAAGVTEIDAKLKQIEELSLSISEHQKNAALRTKKFGEEINNAKAAFKGLESSFKHLEFIEQINVFGKSLKTVEERNQRINTLKTAELELQKEVHQNKKDQMEAEMDFELNKAKLSQMGFEENSKQWEMYADQIELLTEIKRLRGDTLDIENKIAKRAIEQKAISARLKDNSAAVAGTQTGSMLQRTQAFGQIGGPALQESDRGTWKTAKVDEWMQTAKPGDVLLGSDLDAEFDAALKQAELKNLQEVIHGTKGLLDSMAESLKTLGPEGEVVLAVQAGSFAMTDSWLAVGSQIADGTEGMALGASVAAAAAQTIAATANILAAASNARISAIDKEIAMEKKRDGKSKESLAKIKGLEKKKEAIARKAFETNKKMMIAQTIANTAAAYMGIMAHEATKAGVLAPALATIALVMGAAQLAIIMGTSFQGGGGGVDSSPATPSTVALGKRKSSVDLAKARNPAGELAYFRGDRGTGGPEDFRGAFYGRKHRAYGGNAGYIVGEQGPELFMPERPGTIVPADDTADAMAAGGNVTFNISTIDATGVEEVLEEQQGNIIGMLRQAANSYGQEFMEDIDETIYSSPQARRA